MYRQRPEDHPRTVNGNFWRRDIYPYQVWLAGLYMAIPIYIRDSEKQQDVMRQFCIVQQKLYNECTGLYWHAWDGRRHSVWVDSTTDQSPNVWLRALGWYWMTLSDR